MKRRPAHVLVVAALTAAPTLSGCAPQVSSDKGGGDIVELHFATIDSVNPNGQYYGSEEFVDALEEVSGGRLQVEMQMVFGDGAADAETRLVEAIASGELDGGMPSVRAFPRAGIAAFEVLEAPMVITSFAAQKALVAGPIAAELLARLEGTGVVGLGLAVGPLRRPFAAEAPLLGPGDWEGQRFRVYNSPVQTEAVAALGAEPIDMSFEWIDAVAEGSLRGAEFDIPQYHAIGLNKQAGFVTTNVVLWPKVIVLAISQERFDSLTDEQRGWVRQAAEQAVRVSVEAEYDENIPAQELCGQGVVFVDASADEVAALRQRFAPVVARLGADPDTGGLLTELQALAAEHSDPHAPDVPDDCDEIAAPDEAELGDVPDVVSALPDGLYRVEISLADVEGAGLTNADGWTGIWTLEIDDGTYALRCRPLDEPDPRDCGNSNVGADNDDVFEAGVVRGAGNTAYFDYDADVHSRLSGCALPCADWLETYRVSWELDGDTLRFGDLVGEYTAYHHTIKAWQKIG